MKKRGNGNSPRYPKQHNIETIASNEALEQRERDRMHVRLKYEARFGNGENGKVHQYQDIRKSAPYKRLPYRD